MHITASRGSRTSPNSNGNDHGRSASNHGLPARHTGAEAENICHRIFDDAVRRNGHFWHLFTPGERQQIIFVTHEDYGYGMMLMAMCAFDCPDVKIITFELMATHIHAVLCGRKEDCEAFFALFRKRLCRYLNKTNSGISLDNFTPDLRMIADLNSLRTRIAYVNRNNFLVDPGQTPWSFPYGSNGYYFMDAMKRQSDRLFGDLTQKEKGRSRIPTNVTTHAMQSSSADTYPQSVSAIMTWENQYSGMPGTIFIRFQEMSKATRK